MRRRVTVVVLCVCACVSVCYQASCCIPHVRVMTLYSREYFLLDIVRQSVFFFILVDIVRQRIFLTLGVSVQH